MANGCVSRNNGRYIEHFCLSTISEDYYTTLSQDMSLLLTLAKLLEVRHLIVNIPFFFSNIANITKMFDLKKPVHCLEVLK